MKGIIFDLDQTLINSKPAELLRKQRKWADVYKMIPDLKPYDGIDELITLLIDNNIKIAIVTTSPNSYYSRIINYRKWKIDVNVCYHDVKKVKPDPECMILAISKLKLKKEEILSIGDKAGDIISSRLAGIKSGACMWGCEDRVSLLDSKPDFIFENVIDLKNKIFC